MQPGTLTYIPPWWAHRTVNVGEVDSSSLGSIRPTRATTTALSKSEASRLLVKKDGQPTLLPNPRYGELQTEVRIKNRTR